MIAGLFHNGSGLGDQIFRYITIRTLAEEKGFEWGMLHPSEFKGKEFFKDFDFGWSISPYEEFADGMSRWNEKDVRDAQGNDIRSYDPEINFVAENTILDGSFEDDKYWRHNLSNISKWLAVEPLNVASNLCVIGFRGGEYYSDPDLGLPKEYYDTAIEEMQKRDKNMTFQVHTDDPVMAKQFFPDFEVVENTPISHSKHTNMAFNWRSARYAKYAIIPNSAFFIMPRILKHFEDPAAVTIAPRYWARRNTKVWARPACYYKEFQYV